MNDAAYAEAFSLALMTMTDHLGLDAAGRASTGHTIYTVAVMIRYLHEAAENAPLVLTGRILEADDKRLRGVGGDAQRLERHAARDDRAALALRRPVGARAARGPLAGAVRRAAESTRGRACRPARSRRRGRGHSSQARVRGMNALLLGAVAAFGWGLYDFLIRFVSRSGAGSLQAILLVLVFGVATLGAAALITGQEISIPRGEFWPVAVSGAAYAAGLVTGYRAFAIGPVSFVAPIVAAYPVFTILWAVANGARPSLAEWLGVASVLIGVALVARFAADQPADQSREGDAPTRATAFIYAGCMRAWPPSVLRPPSRPVSSRLKARPSSALPFSLDCGLLRSSCRSACGPG